MRLKSSALVGVLLAVTPIWAHHGSAGYDQHKPIHFAGKVSSVEWTNPHVVVHLDVAGADGRVVTWLVNTLPPKTTERLGFAKDSFAVGTEITVDGYQALDGSNHVNGTSIVFRDGKQIRSAACFDNGPQCYKPADGKSSRIQ